MSHATSSQPVSLRFTLMLRLENHRVINSKINTMKDELPRLVNAQDRYGEKKTFRPSTLPIDRHARR
jgi:hypothetical protein